MSLLKQFRLSVLGLILAALVACAAPAVPPTPTAVPTVALTATPSPPGFPIPLRSDIQVRKVLSIGSGVVRLALDPLTNDLYYMDGQANIYRLTLQPGEGSSGKQVYTSKDVGGVPAALGLAFGPDGTLYIVENDLQSHTIQAIIRKGVPDASGARVWSTLASTEPFPRSNTNFDHLFSGIVVSPDGKYVYLNSGSRTDHGEIESDNSFYPNLREVPLTSAIFRLPADGQDLMLPNDEAELKAQGYLYADGTRNAFDLAFAPNGDLFAIDNGPDADYPEELNWIQEGQHYGFPWRFGNYDNPQQFPDYDAKQDVHLSPDFIAVQRGTYIKDPTFPPPPMAFTDPIENVGPDGDQYRGDDGSQKDSSDEGKSIYTFTPHRSPLGLVFDTEGALSDEFKGDAFLLSFGSAGGDLTDKGQDLLHVKLTKNGDTYQAKVTQLVRDFRQPIDSVLIKNKLYVLDYPNWGSEASAIWEVTLP